LIRCYITDRLSCPRDLLDCIERNARAGVDYIQLREKDLDGRELIALAKAALVRLGGTTAKLLINERADVALASGAHGVHLRSRAILPAEWRRVMPGGFLIGVSCHTLDDLQQAEGADFAFYSPVFDSPGKGPALGLDALGEAARSTSIPVLALGGITWDNAVQCVRAGAAGIAAIRLFQNG